MEQMFGHGGSPAREFNSDLSGWDVSKVTNMRAMFQGAVMFNSDISGWNTSNVINMREMFNMSRSFNQNLSEWCVTKIASPPYRFAYGALFQNIVDVMPVWGTCPRGEDS